ncbi:MAG: 50S ribosomal protein L21 [Candidatus Limnocylindrales bacterium]
MYAVIETGGKQYRVELGTELAVELLDVEPGQEITLDRVLLVADGDEAAIGRPLVADAAVSARVLRQDRGEKVISFKYRPKARSRVKKGHRQEQTVLRVTDVRLGSKSAAEDARRTEEAVKTERQRLEEAAARQAAEDAALAAKLVSRDKATPVESAEAAKPAPKAAAKRPRAKAAGPKAAATTAAEAAVGSAKPETPAAKPARRTRAKAAEAAAEAPAKKSSAKADTQPSKTAETPDAAPKPRRSRAKKDE